ncbi:MAG: aldehyde dehydrogenase family protein [Ktedonobacterales bacterium]
MGPLVSEAHLNRVMGYVESGRAEGARVVTGGKRQCARSTTYRQRCYLPARQPAPSVRHVTCPFTYRPDNAYNGRPSNAPTDVLRFPVRRMSWLFRRS